MRITCVGCETEFDYDGYLFYGGRDVAFCPTCKRKPIEVRGKIIVKKEDLNIIKELLR